jgi:hypothetical protein
MKYYADPTGTAAAVVQSTTLRVSNPGDVYDVYFAQQAPSFVVPATVLNSDGTVHLWGAPAPGLTNVQAWALYGVAVAGAITPCQTSRPGIIGFVCPVTTALSAAPPEVRVR